MPEEILRQLAELQGLDPAEAVLARALVRHKLAPEDEVLGAARASAADSADSNKGILARLVSSGIMTEEKAEKVRVALEKLLADRQAAGPAATEEPKASESQIKRKRARMWKPRSQRLAAVEPSTPQKTAKDNERETIDAFLEKYIGSRLHQLLMEKLTRMRSGPADPKELAEACGVTEKEVIAVLKGWKAQGLLVTIDNFPYYFDPPPKVKEAAALFEKAWRDEDHHKRLLARIIELEG